MGHCGGGREDTPLVRAEPRVCRWQDVLQFRCELIEFSGITREPIIFEIIFRLRICGLQRNRKHEIYLRKERHVREISVFIYTLQAKVNRHDTHWASRGIVGWVECHRRCLHATSHRNDAPRSPPDPEPPPGPRSYFLRRRSETA